MRQHNSHFFITKNSLLMNGLFNFQFPKVLTNALGIFLPLVMLLMFSSIDSLQGQDSKIFKCPENTYTFTGFAEQTLCEEYPNFNCEIQIGAGTQYPKSSLLPNASLSGNICIVGTFEVDEPFSFVNAVVKINPGVTIAVMPSPNGYDSGSSLGIDNSKLFACQGLWKGITVGFLSSIGTWNNTVIEDAETAILATGLSALFIQHTTFNRDRVGIELNTPFPNIFVPGPLVYDFSNNSFRCDAPLNGTTDEITFAGVKLKDSYFYTYQQGVNSFQDIIHGIHATGNSTHIGAGNLVMRRIKKDGIFMTHGSLDLKKSRFINTEEKSVNIELAKLVHISETEFSYNSQLPNNTDVYRTGVFVEKFGLAADVKISRISFLGDLNNNESYIRGIHLKGTEVGDGTKIYIGNNSVFNFRAKNSMGIYLDGTFPKTSTTQIWVNSFRVSSRSDEMLGGSQQAINANGGDKNNLSIKWNTFTGRQPGDPYNQAKGIVLEGSAGEGNEVSVNSFSDEVQFMVKYIQAINFENTRYCSNTFTGFGGDGIWMWLNCQKSSIEGNTFTGISSPLYFAENTFTQSQEHLGNTFYDIFFNFNGNSAQYGPVFHAYCEAQPQFNKFTVHVAQRTCGNPNDPLCNFTEYHPERIFPDDMDEFWGVQAGTPSEGCNEAYSAQLISDLDKKIAQGQLGLSSNVPGLKWDIERSLYRSLKQNPALILSDNMMQTFVNTHDQSSIGKFYTVKKMLQDALIAAPQSTAHAQQSLASIEQKIVNMEAIDLQISQNGLTEALKQAKKDLILQIHNDHWNYGSLNSNYWEGAKSNLESVLAYNASVPTIFDYEANWKTVTSIYLNTLINQQDALTEADIQAIKGIASQDPSQGGSAVYTAFALLPDCLRPAAPTSNEREAVRGSGPDSGHITLLSSSENKRPDIMISPNPASESFSILGLNNKPGNIRMFDLAGREIFRSVFSADMTTFNLPRDIQSGIYFLEVNVLDGASYRKKIIIEKQ